MRWRWGHEARLLCARCRRNLVPLSIHALYVGHIIAPMQRSRRSSLGLGPGRGTRQESCAPSHGGPHLRTTGCSADCRSDSCAHDRAVRCAAQRCLRRGLPSGCAADLLLGELPAHGIVDPKLVEWLACSRQHHDVRTDRHRGTGTEKYQHEEKHRAFLSQVSSPPIVVAMAQPAAIPSRSWVQAPSILAPRDYTR